MRDISRDVADLRTQLRSGQYEGLVTRYLILSAEVVTALEEVADAVNAISRLEDALRSEKPAATPEEGAALSAQDERIRTALELFSK